MATQSLLPVYGPEEVGELLGFRIAEVMRERFRVLPDPSSRRISVWYPGLSVIAQTSLEVVQKRKLLWVVPPLSGLLRQAPDMGYYPVCLPAPDTGSLDATGQVAVVAPFGEVACPAPIATWTWLIHFLKTGESLGLGLWMRCAEVPSPGSRVELLAFADRLYVFDGGGLDAFGFIRLASLGTS